MNSDEILQPLVFEPLYMERIWGGRRLETLYGKRLPAGVRIGESWELVDREEAQSVVHDGHLRGRTLHELWTDFRTEIFGEIAESARFPLLLKLLDAQETLSVQVHPPAEAAKELNGEPKTEFWYIADATPAAELFVGLKENCSATTFAEAVEQGTTAEQIHRVSVRTGDAMFLPSGRVHAIGAGNVIIEIQQNSDTTYRVFDWNRTDESGKARTLHVEESLRCIDFDDVAPELAQMSGESLLRHDLFEIEKWNLEAPRDGAAADRCAVVCCVSGGVGCAGVSLGAGELFLLPAALRDCVLHPLQAGTAILRVTIPSA